MGVVSELLDLVLPSFCLGCRRPGRSWCSACRPDSEPYLVDDPSARSPVWAALDYEGAAREALLQFKERHQRPLATELGGYLRDAVDAASEPQALLVPVRSRRAAARERGGDHMLRLTRAAARRRYRVVTALSSLASVDAVGLGRAERVDHSRVRMRAVPCPAGLHGWPVVICDDIVTTGATLRSAATALADAGWNPVASATIAHTRLHHPPSSGEFAPPVYRTGFSEMTLGRGACPETTERSSVAVTYREHDATQSDRLSMPGPGPGRHRSHRPASRFGVDEQLEVVWRSSSGAET